MKISKLNVRVKQSRKAVGDTYGKLRRLKMAVTDEIVSTACDITWFKNWRVRIQGMTVVGHKYVKGEARRYYTDGNGRYYYRGITEAEMHRNK